MNEIFRTFFKKVVDESKVKITWFCYQDDSGISKVLYNWDGTNNLNDDMNFLKNVSSDNVFVL